MTFEKSLISKPVCKKTIEKHRHSIEKWGCAEFEFFRNSCSEMKQVEEVGTNKTYWDREIVETAKEAVFSNFFGRQTNRNCVDPELKFTVSQKRVFSLFLLKKDVFLFEALQAELNDV